MFSDPESVQADLREAARAVRELARLCASDSSADALADRLDALAIGGAA